MDTKFKIYRKTDIVVVGGTPSGIMSSIAAARTGSTVLLLERNSHIGGLCTNGLGITDIVTRGTTLGMFKEFTERILQYYIKTYGKDSQQVIDSDGGYHFEPSVAERILEEMLAEYCDLITVLKMRQFDAFPQRVQIEDKRIKRITVLNRISRTFEYYEALVFIDATYEGDLAAAAGAPYRVGREGYEEYKEPRAGILYAYYEPYYIGSDPHPLSTGLPDNAIQAYNYRICLTSCPENRIPVPKPTGYNRNTYISLIDDIKYFNHTQPPELNFERPKGLEWVINLCRLPNDKTDSNCSPSAFINTDLEEENWSWPTSDWQWRDAYAQHLRDYDLGLLWFIQNDREIPEEIRKNALNWGLAKDEYTDNGNFPRQVYVREGRRVIGEYFFTAHDALPKDGVGGSLRPPVHADSITCSHYHLDSHATRKREPGRIAPEGHFSLKATRPYTVPYGVLVPKNVEGLLVSVAVSATHIGFSTLRMEPCWMALGQAAGLAASMAVKESILPRDIDVFELQCELLKQKAQLIYFEDVAPGHPCFEALQFFALRGFLNLDTWCAQLDEPVKQELMEQLLRQIQLNYFPQYDPQKTTLESILSNLYQEILKWPKGRRNRLCNLN